MDEDLASSLGATTTFDSDNSATAAPSMVSPFGPFSTTANGSLTNPVTGSHRLTEHEKIGVAVGIVAFVLVCCAAGAALRCYRKKRRAANPKPPELYFGTYEKRQASVS